MRHNLRLAVLTATFAFTFGLANAQPKLTVTEDEGTGRIDVSITNIPWRERMIGMRTVLDADREYIASLYDDPEAMRHMRDGKASKEVGMSRCESFMQRANDGNPFNAYLVYEQESKASLSIFIIGFGSQRGMSELAALFSCREEGVMTAVGQAVVSTLIPA